ncbi:hypothetical protein ABPG75_008480 [Micractinium tetrahymenae]
MSVPTPLSWTPAALAASSRAQHGLRSPKPASRRLSLPPRSSAASAGGAGGEDNTGAAFVQRFRSLADAQPISADTGSNGGSCGGGTTSGDQGVAAQSGAGSCGCSGGAGAGASGAAAAAAVSSQLNSLMSGLEGSLSREDLQAAFQAAPSGAGSSPSSGERFLDVSAILRGEGGADDDDADLDALVV